MPCTETGPMEERLQFVRDALSDRFGAPPGKEDTDLPKLLQAGGCLRHRRNRWESPSLGMQYARES